MTTARRHGVSVDQNIVKKPRGLAAVDPERRREIARMGGRAAFDQGKCVLFDSKTGSEAGKLGGRPTHKDRRELQAS